MSKQHEQRAIHKAAGLNVDPETAEVLWEHGSGLDPYGLHDLSQERDNYIQRNYFARAPGGDVWVWFGDLPDNIRDALWEKHKSHLAYPAGSGFGPLPVGSPPLEINTGKNNPRYLIVEKSGLRPDTIYALVGLFDHRPNQAAMMGWEWGHKLSAAPVRDFGYGVLSHYIPAGDLNPPGELQALLGKSHGRA
jgi:hypothetical protein